LERWKFADFVVTAGVCVAVACLFFPALINSRFHSEAALCQNRLRQSGQKLTMYSQEHNNHYPMVDASGNAAVAGIYTVKLAQQGLVDDPRCFQCPGKNWTLMLSIPRWEDLLNAKGAELTSMHVVMGGDYAYTLPYLDRGRLQGIRNVGSKYAPVLADAPLENARNVSISSHGRGQNVLFQDGHVRFLTTRIRPGAYPDDVFFNDQGRIRAGVHNEDFVLGASHVSPLAGQSR
jgi:prepilin-type processing-associated H-X9-DG protein